MATVGQAQRRATAIGAVRLPDAAAFHKTSSIYLVDAQLSLTALAVGKAPAYKIDSFTDSFTWNDAPTIEGELTLRLPDDYRFSIPLDRGHRVRLEATGYGQTSQVWTMRCRAPEVDPIAGTLTIGLVDQFQALRGVVRPDWTFKAGKSFRPYGWTAKEIVVHICKELGLPVHPNELAACTVRKSWKFHHESAYEVMVKAYNQEAQASGRTFVYRMVNGHVSITPRFKRNDLLFVLRDQIMNALLSAQAPEDTAQLAARPATVVTCTGTMKVDGKIKKESVTVSQPSLFAALGKVHGFTSLGRVHSRRDLERHATRVLAAGVRVQPLIKITHPGLPFIQRGDAMKMVIPGYGYDGTVLIFVQSASHTVAGGTYTTDLELIASDASATALRAEQEFAIRQAKRLARASG